MKQKGFTLIETILAMTIIMMMTLLIIPMMTTIKTMNHHPRYSDDLLMIQQMRMDLCIQNNISTNGMQLMSGDHYYEYDQHRLIQRPGYMIFLQDIDAAYFNEKEDGIYLYFQRKNKEYEVYLCEKT